MKILVIRGENLASLEGAFEVDFGAGPLERAGLFAITGPTGAGKTTLLDALCLALFGTTPRVKAVPGHGHDVGRGDDAQRIRSNDARALLRRGAGSGFAEVEFAGRDGKRYVARWTVRRARGKADGKLQNVDRTLRDDEGVAIGRTLGEVQQAIDERVGLDYEQFCRSVLLAQGEFAAFLRANEKTRAELLEAVTGTGIYRELSIKAHERFAAAKQALLALRQEHDAQPVLEPEALAALQAELAARELAFAAAKAALDGATAALRWYGELAVKAEAEAAAAGALAAADAAWGESAPLRSQLAAVDEVAQLRQLVAAADDAVMRRDAAARALGEAEVAAGVAAAARDAAQAALAVALERERELAAAREALAPVIKEALQLDAALGAAERRRLDADDEAGRQAARAATSARAVETLEKEAAGLERAIATNDTWRAAHEGWQPVAAQWERWEAALLRAAEMHGARRRGETELPQREAALAQAEAALVSARSGGEEAAAGVSAAEASLVQAEAARPALAGAALRALREGAEEETTLARELEARSREAVAAAAAQAKAGEAIAALHAEGAGLEAQRAAFAADRERLKTAVGQAEAKLVGARAVLDLAGHRAELVPGEACPLCGSEAHPYAEEAPAAARLVDEFRERLEGLRGELVACETRHGEIGVRLEALGKQGALLREELRTQEAAGAAAQAAWEAGRARAAAASWAKDWEEALGVVAQGDTAATLPVAFRAASLPEAATAGGTAVAGWTQSLGARRELLRRLEAAAEAAERDAQRARSDLETARSRAEKALAVVRTAEAGAQAEAAALGEARATLARVVEEMERQRGELAAAFAGVDGFEAQLASDPAALAGSAAETVAALRSREAERSRALHRRDEIAAAAAPARAAAEEARVDAAGAAAALQACVEELAGLRAKRAGLLGGAPVAVVEERQRREAEAALAALELARKQEAATVAAASAADARVEAARAQVLAETAQATERVAAVGAAAAERGIDEGEIRRRLAIAPAEVSRWRAEVERLDRARVQASSVLEDRRAQREVMEASARPAVSREEAEPAVLVATAARDVAEHAFHDTRKALAADAAARERSAAFLPRIEAAEREHARWEKMHELIGSSGGDKFQLFAQSLTLDALLASANAHLADLAPRYRLERAPGSNLELQVVDRDMADEVRSTSSLSGGETFLVSLALALGLSALSSRSTKVESLFIDEGFGTLDPQTLDTALATLDALQAAGRKVGLISHVQGMAERIGVQVRVAPQGSGSSRVEVLVA